MTNGTVTPDRWVLACYAPGADHPVARLYEHGEVTGYARISWDIAIRPWKMCGLKFIKQIPDEYVRDIYDAQELFLRTVWEDEWQWQHVLFGSYGFGMMLSRNESFSVVDCIWLENDEEFDMYYQQSTGQKFQQALIPYPSSTDRAFWHCYPAVPACQKCTLRCSIDIDSEMWICEGCNVRVPLLPTPVAPLRKMMYTR